ncbi:MAG: hypothetical protein JNM55_20920 [Anaerolineales bacterium]|nr:hypothetical protein [Anaerolineales bacterium]
MIIWVLCDDGRRRSFRQEFTVAFHVRGPSESLYDLWKFLKPKGVQLARVKGTDLYDGTRDDILEAKFDAFDALKEVFYEAKEAFPDLTYYDVDTELYLRYWAAFNLFPFARCKLTVNGVYVQTIEPLDSRWDIDPARPPLRTLFMKPDVDPSRRAPKFLQVKYEGFDYKLQLDEPRKVLDFVNDVLNKYNPDMIITEYGDKWLFDYLAKVSQETGIPFRPNRDYFRDVVHKGETKFHTYGQAHHRDKQVHLLGRSHIDTMNCSNYHKYGFDGAMELAQITGIPIQESARRSAGAGISAMQVLTALRWNVMVPYQYQKGETPKTWRQLFLLDRGGLIDVGPPGLHKNVFVIDFFMMYPSLMIRDNLSPETVGVKEKDAILIPGTGLKVSRKRGLIPETLEPMRDKRMRLQEKAESLPEVHPERARYIDRADAIKDLGVVSNGRLAFANAIFGRLPAYEALAFLGRRTLLDAKEIAEAHGFTVLYMCVDSLFLTREGACTKADIKPVIDAIEAKTKLRLSLDGGGVYSWMAFVASRKNPKRRVAHRYYGLNSEDDFKVRGLALRRRDTCPFVASLQRDAMGLMGLEKDPDRLAWHVPNVINLIRECCDDLQNGKIPLDQLVITRKLSRELNEYKVSSVVVRAAKQLQAAGRKMGMGRIVRYLLTRNAGGSYPWDLADQLCSNMVDVRKYMELVIRATYELLQPIGVSEEVIRGWLGGATYVLPEDWAYMGNMELPLFASVQAPTLVGIDVTRVWPTPDGAKKSEGDDIEFLSVALLAKGSASGPSSNAAIDIHARREGAGLLSDLDENLETDITSSQKSSRGSEYYAPIPDIA